MDNINFAKWTEDQVSSWLRSIGVKETYINKLYEEEVSGQVLEEITEDFLIKKAGMKSGQVLLVISKRDQLIQSAKKAQKAQLKELRPAVVSKSSGSTEKPETPPEDETQGLSIVVPLTKRDCKPRAFGKEGMNLTYVNHSVLQPETGVSDLISPSHEYKSFATAAKLERTKLQAKFAKEVLRFGTGCMNMRSNGTIHFGVMDSREDNDFVHGEVIGVPVPEKDIYVDALDHIERCCSKSDAEHLRLCIRPPEFIEVTDLSADEKRYVVEVDIVPMVSIVRHKVYAVRLPNFNEKSNKVIHEKEAVYYRVGASTKPVDDTNEFYQRISERDSQRENAENRQYATAPESSQDLGRKLTMLVTGGKKYIDEGQWFILVTNRFNSEDLSSIDFLLNMKIFCVFDFDPDSNISGFCHEYQKRHAANLHCLQSYILPNGMSIGEFQSQMHLFEQTSWIFCNGRNDFRAQPCNDMTWFKTKKTHLKECVSLICKQILPKGVFTLIFLLTSPVEGPILQTYSEFFSDMGGHEDIICICESQDHFEKWQNFARGSFCDECTVNRSSVVGMKMSHVNATLQRIQCVAPQTTKHLPTYVKGVCLLETREEERMYSLEILYVDHCDEIREDFIDAEKESIEQHFYHGGKISWIHFWLADKRHIGEVIQRDAYHEISNLLSDCLKKSADQFHVHSLNIFHHPGSGGSTVARQVLWNNRKKLRCAVVKPSYAAHTVSEHAHILRTYEENDTLKCLPVLLLVEDCDEDFLDELHYELQAMKRQRFTQGALCFIVLSCRRSYNPEKMCKESPLHNVQVTHKLSEEEKRQFAGKRRTLEKHYQPDFILTFVLMSEGFDHQKIVEYVEHFVEHLLQGIDHESVVTRLIRYIALLNTYVQNSYLSQSHCEALLAIPIHLELLQSNVKEHFRRRAFEEALTEPARLVLIHLRDETTHIQSIRIIHPSVAKEILQQLLLRRPIASSESVLALELLRDSVLFEHRFGREEYGKFLRALFMRRDRIVRGDEADSFFSPLIEHVRDTESPEKAIDLLQEAYKRFDKDPLFAQHLARLYYSEEKFVDAEHWAEVAAKKLPKNPFVLNTKGQVYRRWFYAKLVALKKQKKTAERMADAIKTAVKAIDCFQDCQRAAIEDPDCMSNSGVFAAVEVGCRLSQLFFSSGVFSDNAECVKYLLTDYIPEEVTKPWENFHVKLKGLQKIIHKALEWLSEDLSYFQTDTNTDEEDSEDPIKHPKNWLVSNSMEYGKYFCNPDYVHSDTGSNIPTPVMTRMKICKLGGGNMIAIFSLLTDQRDKDQVAALESIISLYKLLKPNMDQIDLVNYIASHIALSCLTAQSKVLATVKELQCLSQKFLRDKQKCPPKAHFLLTLLLWPEKYDSEEDKEEKYKLVSSAVKHLTNSYRDKMKDIPSRKRRICAHFFLGHGSGLDKLVHRSRVESATKSLPVSEKRMRWYHEEGWKTPKITSQLKCLSGWTENGKVYLEGPQKSEFIVPALNIAFVPYSNENVTFYLGFTMRGPMAYNVTVKK